MRRLTAALSGGLALFLAPAPATAELTGEFGIGAEFEQSRSAGTSDEFVAIPVSLSLFSGRFDLGLDIPWQIQEGPGVYNGTFVGRQYRGGRLIRPADRGSAADSSLPASSSDESSSGFGDLTASLGWRLADETVTTPNLRFLAAIKFPTGGAERGTDAVDYGLGLSLDKGWRFGRFFAEGRYIVAGASDLYQTRNYALGQLGHRWELGESAGLALLLRASDAAAVEIPGYSEARLRFDWSLLPRLSLETYVAHRLGGAAADWGGGVALYHRFGD